MHDLSGAGVIHARLFVVDVHTMIVVFGAIKAEKIVTADHRPYERVIDQIIVKIVHKTTVFILGRALADCSFNWILVDIPDNNKKLIFAVDWPAVESGLKESSDTLVFFVVPVNEAGRDVLKDPSQGHCPCFNNKMNMIGHQAVSENFITAFGLKFTENRQKLAVIIFVLKYSLFVNAAINYMINSKRADFAR